jgi:hypothetical protein
MLGHATSLKENSPIDIGENTIKQMLTNIKSSTTEVIIKNKFN